MNDISNKKQEIEKIIYEIRGKQVMLDSDLAKLYSVETKRINEAVKKNLEKFPERFSWSLTDDEYLDLRSKISTSSLNKHGGRRYNPRVFTEQGVAMLATILKSKIATKVSIAIMDAFVAMRKYISNNLIEQKYINSLVLEHESDIKLLQESFDRLSENQSINGLFFEGQIYDSYSLLIDILNTSTESIVIIDNYIDKNLLDILRNIEKSILIITNKYNNEDYNKYKTQYTNISLKINNSIHDRFIIIDNKHLYHCGASLKDLGKKCFAINKIENEEWLNEIIKKIDYK